MNTRNIVKNIRSAEVIQGKPKLPTTGQLSEGEIAVNYAKGYETLSFKNNSDEIVSLSVKTVDDVTVNGNSVVSNKTANITMKGSTTPVADTYTTTTYPSPFNEGAEHISASDKVDVALKKVETNISKLVSEVVDNENVVSDAISKLANSAGTIDGSNNITYVKATNAHYISDATSVHDATVKLDSNVYTIKRAVDDIGNNVDTLNGNVNIITNDVNTIKRAVDGIGNNVDTLNSNVNRITNDVNTIEGKVTNLKSFCDTNFHQVFGQIGDLQDQINSLRGIISSIPTMEYVDLGLPSGLQWAKCNIGAATETDYGDYFMWGSTTPDNNHTCNWTNTPFNNGSSGFDETYFNSIKNTVCPNGVLAKEYDAAYKATNGIGRMPTTDECDELINFTDNQWVTNHKGTGVNGWMFTSRTDTSKYIFIPASGYRDNSSFSFEDAGNVWSSSLDDGVPGDAWFLSFFSEGIDTSYEEGWNMAFAVRAVRK